MELTEVRTGDETWWSLGLEAIGPAHLLRTVLEATAALVFAQPIPRAPNLAQTTPVHMRSGCISGRVAGMGSSA